MRVWGKKGSVQNARDPKGSLLWIWRVTGRTKGIVALLAVLQVALGLYGVALAWLLRCLVDDAVAGDARGFMWSCLTMAALLVVQLVVSWAFCWADELGSAQLENRCKGRLMQTLLSGDLRCVGAVHSGEWMNRLTNDTAVVADGVVQIVPGFVGTVAKLVGSVALLTAMVPRLALALVACGLVLVGTSYAFRRVMKRLHKRIQEADGRLRIVLTERLSGMLVVRAFSREAESVAAIQEAMQGHLEARMRRNRFSNVVNTGFSLAMGGAFMASVAWCGWGIVQGTLGYGTLVAVMQLVSQVEGPFANVSAYVSRFFAMTASAERLMEAEGYACEDKAPLTPEMARGFYERDLQAVGLDGVSFGYGSALDADGNGQKSDAKNRSDGTKMPVAADGSGPEVREVSAAPAHRVAVSDISLEIVKDSLTVFAGPSGCGKSTVLKLLMGLYRPDSGECYVRTDAGRKPLGSELRTLFAYVPQGNCLMSGTIREAVAFGDALAQADDARLRSALEAACAWDFVSALPLGLETPLGERGAGLSEGQLQRLAIARALVTRRPILLLDECTSSLDGPTEHTVLANLAALEGVTVVAVAHRPAVLDIADQVVWFGESATE